MEPPSNTENKNGPKFTRKPSPSEHINRGTENEWSSLAHLFGLFAALCVCLYFLSGVVGDLIADNMSPAMEVELGKKLNTAKFVLVGDSAAKQEEYLQQIVDKIISASGQQPRLPVVVKIIDDSAPNAFCAFGGDLYVTTGFLKSAESENELAFVLGHELGHFFHKHPIKGLSQNLVFVLISASLGFDDQVREIMDLGNLKFSRFQEEEADVWGVKAVAAVYGHLEDSSRFFERIKEKNFGPEGLSYLTTHPSPTSRIDKIKEYGRKSGTPMKGRLTKLPAKIFDAIRKKRPFPFLKSLTK